MQKNEWLAQLFEANRTHLRAVAYRMLGSLSEAEDAVQTSWLRLSSSDTSGIENMGGWLTTVVARICLDLLRSHKSRREESLDAQIPEPTGGTENRSNTEDEVLLADSVGLALLVVLNTLDPDERLAFVLHDIFDVPFDEIALILKRSPKAARQLAYRARHRVRGAARVPNADLTSQRKAVEAFLAASHDGDFDALLALLDPDVVFRADTVTTPSGQLWEIHGAPGVAKQFSRRGSTRSAQPALINGVVGIVIAPRGHLLRVLDLTITSGKIVAINAIADPQQLRQLDLAVLSD